METENALDLASVSPATGGCIDRTASLQVNAHQHQHSRPPSAAAFTAFLDQDERQRSLEELAGCGRLGPLLPLSIPLLPYDDPQQVKTLRLQRLHPHHLSFTKSLLTFTAQQE